MKSATERDLSQMGSEFVRVTRSASSACLNLNTNVHNIETQSAVSNTCYRPLAPLDDYDNDDDDADDDNDDDNDDHHCCCGAIEVLELW